MNRAVGAVAIDTLGSVPLFADLDDDELQLIADAMRERTFPRGETVTEEGAVADGFFVIESGQADVLVDGQPRGTMNPGAFFGEVALLMGSTRTATVRATTELRCYVLAPLDFRTIVEGNPTIAFKVLQSADSVS
jgi:CRP-like cAMP-binding protein